MKFDFYRHTTYCDGKHSSEDVILYAEENGFLSIKFDEAIKMLRSFGFTKLYTIYNKRFEKYGIKRRFYEFQGR